MVNNIVAILIVEVNLGWENMYLQMGVIMKDNFSMIT